MSGMGVLWEPFCCRTSSMSLSCYRESRYHLYNCVRACMCMCVCVGGWGACVRAYEIYNLGPCCVDHIADIFEPKIFAQVPQYHQFYFWSLYILKCIWFTTVWNPTILRSFVLLVYPHIDEIEFSLYTFTCHKQNHTPGISWLITNTRINYYPLYYLMISIMWGATTRPEHSVNFSITNIFIEISRFSISENLRITQY